MSDSRKGCTWPQLAPDFDVGLLAVSREDLLLDDRVRVAIGKWAPMRQESVPSADCCGPWNEPGASLHRGLDQCPSLEQCPAPSHRALSSALPPLAVARVEQLLSLAP